jgi:hypothetical protein
MKVHELIDSMPRVITDAKVAEAGRAIIAEALREPCQLSPLPQAAKMRLKEFLLLSAKTSSKHLASPAPT